MLPVFVFAQNFRNNKTEKLGDISPVCIARNFSENKNLPFGKNLNWGSIFCDFHPYPSTKRSETSNFCDTPVHVPSLLGNADLASLACFHQTKNSKTMSLSEIIQVSQRMAQTGV